MPHHILTSRPYLNTLSYEVKMEITGFTDENIQKYVQNFFNLIEDKSENKLIKKDTILQFLTSKPSVWGIAHIPVNLELICSFWSNQKIPDLKNLTIEILYSKVTEWLCRTYLKKHNYNIETLFEHEINTICQEELKILEILAWHAMENNTIIIRPDLLKTIFNEIKATSQNHLKIMQLGILKSYNTDGTGDQTESNKDHYFIHLSFQEYFAARHLIRTLHETSYEATKTCISRHKYNPRYALVFRFMADLVSETKSESTIHTFWNLLHAEPIDLVGVRHMQLIISCMDATNNKFTISHHPKLLETLTHCIMHQIEQQNKIILKHILQSLQTIDSLTNNSPFINIFILLLQTNNTAIGVATLSILSTLNISNPSHTLIKLVTTDLNHPNTSLQYHACNALVNMGKKAATNEVIKKLVSVLGDPYEEVRGNACKALENMGEKAATVNVIRVLVSMYRNVDKYIPNHAIAGLAVALKSSHVLKKLKSGAVLECYERYPVMDILCKLSLGQLVTSVDVLFYCAAYRGAAIVLSGDKLVVYESKKSEETVNISPGLCVKMKTSFKKKRYNFQLSFDIPE